LRLGLAIRRYWPLPGGLENIAGRMCGALAERGHHVTVVTPRAQSDWPKETLRGGVEIVRLEPPAGGWWSDWFYRRRLARATAAIHRAGGLDAMIVSGLRHDAYTLLKACDRLGVPVVLQPERPGLSGDCHWQLDARFGSRIKRRCYKAAGYVALTPLLERELIAAGYARPRIHHVPLGVPPAEAAEPVELGNGAKRRQTEARRNLAQADPALAADLERRVVVYVGRLRVGKGVDLLLAAWRKVCERRADAVLWLVGEGPDAGKFRERAIELGLVGRVRLTGAFDDVDDVFRAADIAVFPALEDGPAVGLLEAASYGLPIVASDVVTHRDFLADGEAVRTYPRNDADALAAALQRLLDDPAAASALGAAARRTTVEERSLAKMIDAYEQVLASVTAGRSSGQASDRAARRSGSPKGAG
jgi:glycosyltransferase involved in cell wall biosynthesis